jgi:hypothetical protein
MIYFAPLLGTFGCACCRRRLLRLHVLPIASPILFHEIGGYDPRVSIGLRQRAVVWSVKCKPRVHEVFAPRAGQNCPQLLSCPMRLSIDDRRYLRPFAGERELLVTSECVAASSELEALIRIAGPRVG